MHKPRFWILPSFVLLAALVRLAPYILANTGLTDAAQFNRAFEKHVVTRAIGNMGLAEATQFAVVLWSFSPITALFLFGGAHFADRRWAYLAPLAAMFLSDLGIGLLRGDMSQGLHAGIPAMYGSYVVIVWLGGQLRKLQSSLSSADAGLADKPRVHRWQAKLLFLLAACGAGIAGEALFFAVTNFATWVVQTDYYPHTPAGLVLCYLAGIPFFKHALVSTPVYTVALFGGYALAESWFPALTQSSFAPAKTQQSVAA